MNNHVFVLGLDTENREILERTPRLADCTFHALLSRDELRGVERFPIGRLLETCEQRLRAHDGTVDAIFTLLDFPATELVPILADRFGVPGPSLESVLACNHKYWSRLIQRDVAIEHVPPFSAFDPYDSSSLSLLCEEMEFPIWVKPMNAYRSQLGFRVGSLEELEIASEVFREQLPRLSDPLQQILDYADVPAAVAALPQHACLAEGIIGGLQCTLEGYVDRAKPVVYGVVDSIREPNGSTFARYQYPSRLPKRVQRKMAEIACTMVEGSGFDRSAFNVEFYYDRRREQIWLLEINPRASQSHAALFERVDGESNQSMGVDVALGRPPRSSHGQGKSRVAAKFFVRAFADAVIDSLPKPEELCRAERAVPGASVTLLVDEGTQLSQLRDEDSYSYELAHIFLGAPSQKVLLARYRKCMDLLNFKLGTPPPKKRRRRSRVQEIGAVPHRPTEGPMPEPERVKGGVA